ncbi:MAG: tetratricopeptide repeat protein [Elusimicrobiota bacterium]
MKNVLIIFLLLILALTGWWANKNFNYPYPAPVDIVTEKTKPIDFAGFLFGMRRIIADIMWVQTLQYYGGGGWEDKVSEEKYRKYEKDDRKKSEYGRYRDLLAMCQRCVRIDPYFKYVYAFGGASLAWNLTRYDEALELLNEGMKYNPQYYPFHLYAAAIVYSKEGKSTDVIKKLEETVKYPDCPFEVKLILGNIYTKYGRYEDAANIWVNIYYTAKLEDRKKGAKQKLIKLITEKKLSEKFLEKIKDI